MIVSHRLSSDSPYSLDTKAQKIDYMIERVAGFPSVQSLSELLEEARDEEYLEEISGERNGLFDEMEALSPEAFDRRFTEIQQAVQNDVDRFCKPVDTAIFTQWIEKDAWSPAEALSLWLDLDPRFGAYLIAWAQRNRGLALAAVEITERWELIDRAMSVGELVHPFRPKLFAYWADSKRKLPERFADWLSGTTQGAKASSIDGKLGAEAEQLREEISRLRLRLADLNKPHYKLSVKLFAVLCIGVYGFKPARRNTATQLVTELVNNYIEDKSNKTVLDYIRSAIGDIEKGDIDKLSMLYSEKFGAMGKPTISFGKLP